MCFLCIDSDNESKDGSTTQEKKHGRVSQPINTIAYTVSAYIYIYMHGKRHNWAHIKLWYAMMHSYEQSSIETRRLVAKENECNLCSDA